MRRINWKEQTEKRNSDKKEANRMKWKSAWRWGRDLNPWYGFDRIHAFQACSFNHSDTSPLETRAILLILAGLATFFWKIVPERAFVSYYSQPAKTRKPLFHRHLKISPWNLTLPWAVVTDSSQDPANPYIFKLFYNFLLTFVSIWVIILYR